MLSPNILCPYPPRHGLLGAVMQSVEGGGVFASEMPLVYRRS